MLIPAVQTNVPVLAEADAGKDRLTLPGTCLREA